MRIYAHSIYLIGMFDNALNYLPASQQSADMSGNLDPQLLVPHVKFPKHSSSESQSPSPIAQGNL